MPTIEFYPFSRDVVGRIYKKGTRAKRSLSCAINLSMGVSIKWNFVEGILNRPACIRGPDQALEPSHGC